MKKLLILSLAAVAGAFTNFTKPNTFVDSAVITATPFNQNFDSTAAAINRNADTTDRKFIRFTDLTSGDSTLKRIQVDTIRSNPNIDSISGNPRIDSIIVSTGILGRLTGNVSGNLTSTGANTIDSAHARTIITTGKVGIGIETPTAKLESYASDVAAHNDIYAGSFSNARQFGLGGYVRGGGNSQPYYHLKIDKYDGTNKLVFDGLGRLGIDTITPAEKIHIKTGNIRCDTIKANLNASGFSILGTGAPSIKMKKLTGTTDASEGGFTSVAHGLTVSKIIGVSVMVTVTTGSTYKFMPGAFDAGYMYEWQLLDGNLLVINHPTSSESILGKAFTALITYEE